MGDDGDDDGNDENTMPNIVLNALCYFRYLKNGRMKFKLLRLLSYVEIEYYKCKMTFPISHSE